MNEPEETANDDVSQLGYQAALEELETILDRLEADVPDVDRIAADVARAAAIVQHCRGRIVAAREQVEAVVDSFTEPSGDPRASEATSATADDPDPDQEF